MVDPYDLSCSICLDVFNEPRAFSCLHSFCYACPEGWVKKSKSNKTICCPSCKVVSPVPSGGLKTIKYNYFLADQVKRMNGIDVKSRLKGAKSRQNIRFSVLAPIYCKNHPRNPIDQYCADCDFAVCVTCLLRNHRHHNLVDLAERVKISNK